MSSSYINGLKFCGVTFLTLLACEADAQTKTLQATLQIEPGQCVALRRGSACYQDVRITWRANETGNYCLHVVTRSEPLKCWNKSQTGQYEYELVTEEGVSYTLKHQSSDQELAVEKLDVAWVYKRTKRAQSTWRMF